MCRWMAWHGQSVLIDEILFKPQHGLIDQSLHSRLGAETTNGDGFGLGWYGAGEGPGLFKSIEPAWGDANLRHIAEHVQSPLFLAHVRATSGTAIQQSNCHPFKHGKWLFVHNGVVGGFPAVRRDLSLAIAPDLYPELLGSADSEILFLLALTFGLELDPIGALERTLGVVEATASSHGVDHAIQASIGVSDGESVWAVRYSTEHHSRTLFISSDVDAVHTLYPDNSRLSRAREGDRLIVSEPFSDLPGLWHEIPESTAITVHPDGSYDLRPFEPRVAAAA
jgi:predicted glutamine amidotransferase